MSAQCQHGVLRYECPKCDRARKKREMGMDYNELVRRLRSGCAPDVCPDERDEAADAILALRADRDSQQRGCIRAMEQLAAAQDSVSFNAYRALEQELAAARALLQHVCDWDNGILPAALRHRIDAALKTTP